MADNPFQPRKSLDEAIEKLRAMIAKVNSSDVIYCDICDGLRPREHRCVCWVCGMPREECECESEEGDDDGK